MHNFVRFIVRMIFKTADCLEYHFGIKKVVEPSPDITVTGIDDDGSTICEENGEADDRDENYGKATPIRYERGALDREHPSVEYLLVNGKPIKSVTHSYKVRAVQDGNSYIAA